jgi:hypothetical protein
MNLYWKNYRRSRDNRTAIVGTGSRVNYCILVVHYIFFVLCSVPEMSCSCALSEVLRKILLLDIIHNEIEQISCVTSWTYSSRRRLPSCIWAVSLSIRLNR